MYKIKQIKLLFVQKTAYTLCLILSLPVYTAKCSAVKRLPPSTFSNTLFKQVRWEVCLSSLAVRQTVE